MGRVPDVKGEMMKRILVLLLAMVACVGTATSQLVIQPNGPFIKKNYRPNDPLAFQAKILDPNLTAEEYNFQLYVQDGAGTRTLQSQVGPNWWIWIDMLNLPPVPEPMLSVVVRVRHKYSGTAFTLSQVMPLRFVDANIKIVEVRGWNISESLTPLIVGKEQGQIYSIYNVQPKTTRSILLQLGPKGDTLKRQELVGTPYLSQAILDTAYSLKWPGGRRLRGTVFYDGGPADGYTVETIIPDSIPAPVVEASLGFGPFKAGVDQLNTFVVKGLGPLCDSVRWTVQYETDNGLVRTPVQISRGYDGGKDSMHLVLNMRDISPRSVLLVTARYGQYLPLVQRAYPLMVDRPEPRFRFAGSLPIVPGVDGIDTVVIDSLPPRTLNVKMILTSGSGANVREVNVSRIAPAYIRSASIPINRRDLSLGTYVVRVRALNDFKDDGPDYFYGFDVRDTSKFFLVADTWGPFVRGDSGTFTPAITDVRPVVGQKPDKVLGRFMLIDTLNPTRPLYVSVPVDLSGVRSRDTVVYCPDSSYVIGDARYRRVRFQTINLPFTTHVRFERLIVRGSDTTRDQLLDHPVYIVPSPGTLTTTPRLDTTFIVTRNQPLTMTLSDIVPEATAVRFSILGMKDPDPVVEQIVPRTVGQSSVSWSVDAGLLPVNAKVVVSVITPLANDVGASITKIINTTPDVLSMTAIPPIDQLVMDWKLDPATQLITGVDPFTSKLTFTKIPAQTRTVEILSYDDQGGVIDSVSVPVAYRTKYDPLLKVETDFTFRTMNTASLQVRYTSDGGPVGGLRYNYGIKTGYYRPGMVQVEKMNLQTSPPSIDSSSVLQGSGDVVAIKMRWSQYNTTSPSGYASSLKIDSVRMEIRDCAENILDSRLITPHPAVQSGGIIADTLYPVRKLPLSTTRVIYRLYSKSLTLPATGMVYSAPLSLQTNPIVHIPLGTSYPTYRVNDTTTGDLNQQMIITNLDGVTSVEVLELESARGSALRYSMLTPQGDTIRVPEFNFNTLSPENSPYTLRALVNTSTCSRAQASTIILATITVPRIADTPATSNWIYSSKGWGPFQQGRPTTTQIVASLNPAALITNRAGIADSLEVSVVGWSAAAKIFTPDVPQKFSFPLLTPLPRSIRVSSPLNLTPFDTASFVTLRVKWLRRNLDGVRLTLDTLLRYPITMLPFPDQPIEAETEGYEQSVLAGSSGSRVMESLYDFTMRPQSSSINRLQFTMLSTTEHVLDTVSIVPVSRNTAEQTSLFEMKHDVAQYPWPYIAREREKVNIEIGYQFEGATKPTKIQKTAISILPRADWLNGTVATLDGAATATSIPLNVSIPLPSSWYEVNPPMFDTVRFGVGPQDLTKTTPLSVRATYNPTTRQFTMVGRPNASALWTPSVSLFGGANINYENVAEDGKKSGEFEALYRFERSPLADNSDTVDNRELRLRSLYTSSYSGPIGAIRWVKGLAKTIGDIAKLGSAAATGGLLWVEPYFVLDASVQHLAINNIGTEKEGSILFLGAEEPPTKDTEPNEFPTSHAMGFTITGGGGVDVSFIGLIGLGVGVSQDYLFGSGTTFAGSVLERTSQYYPMAIDVSQWFNIELSLFFGIVRVELFHGRYLHVYDPRLMPSFLVFGEGIGSIFKKSVMEKRGESPLNVTQIGKLPQEMPVYRPAPALDGNDNVLVSAHLEQTLLGNSGRIVLSHLDTTTHSLLPTTVVADNRNAIHDPNVSLCGNGGSVFIGWAQNDGLASATYGSDDIVELLRYENAYLSFYDATTQTLQHLPKLDDQSASLFDASPVVAVDRDTMHAMAAWHAMGDDVSFADVFVRPLTRESGAWTYGPMRRIIRLPGVDRAVHIVAMNDGSYVVSWLNNGPDQGEVKVMSATVTRDGSSRITVVATMPERTIASDIKMVGNGTDAVLLFSSSANSDDTENDRSLLVARYRDGSWSESVEVDPGMGRGILRHVQADLHEDGTFFAMIDGFDQTSTSQLNHNVIACIGSINDSPSSWRVFRNTSVVSPADRDIWSMSAVIGPAKTLYVATQELDSLRGNQQTYGSGLQLGPARCNAVIRAFQYTDAGEVVARPFGNAPTSVDESATDQLEASLRYRIQVLDPAPNPVRDACVVPLAVQKPTRITVRLVDHLGREVSTLYAGVIETGMQGVSFETSNLAPGHYTVVVTDAVGLAGSVPIVVVR
ncbi:MAG: hypothetical protein RL594_309 [Bacteroidota bacterium]|jgi:hypothetical protein